MNAVDKPRPSLLLRRPAAITPPAPSPPRRNPPLPAMPNGKPSARDLVDGIVRKAEECHLSTRKQKIQLLSAIYTAAITLRFDEDLRADFVRHPVWDEHPRLRPRVDRPGEMLDAVVRLLHAATPQYDRSEVHRTRKALRPLFDQGLTTQEVSDALNQHGLSAAEKLGHVGEKNAARGTSHFATFKITEGESEVIDHLKEGMQVELCLEVTKKRTRVYECRLRKARRILLRKKR